MKRKRHICAVLLCALVLAGLFTACGSSSNTAAADSAGSGNSSSVPYDDALADEMGWAADTENSVTDSTSETAPSGSEILSQEKIIRTASMEMETQAFDDAVAALDQLVEELEGLLREPQHPPAQHLPQRQLHRPGPSSVLRRLSGPGGPGRPRHLQDESLVNVSESYYDIEARLATQRTKLERLQALLEQAATMEDIIELESAISDTELEIEYLTGSLRQYDSPHRLRHHYRQPPGGLPPVHRPGAGPHLLPAAGAAFSTGLHRGIDGLEDLIIGLARKLGHPPDPGSSGSGGDPPDPLLEAPPRTPASTARLPLPTHLRRSRPRSPKSVSGLSPVPKTYLSFPAAGVSYGPGGYFRNNFCYFF